MAENPQIPSPFKAQGPTEQELRELLGQIMSGDAKAEDKNHAENSGEDLFYQDAMEGLKAFDSTDSIKKNTDLINLELQKKLHRHTRKKSVQLSHVFWYIIAVIVVIMIIVLSFAVIRLKN